MCGIGGAYFEEKVDLQKLEKLILRTESRGQDGFGIAVVRGNQLATYYKSADKFSTWLKSDVWKKIADSLEPGDLILWNNRAQPMTEVTSSTVNMQPIYRKNYVLVHNGVVSNAHLLQRTLALNLETKIDSEVIVALLELHEYSESFIKAIQESFRLLSGGFAVALINLLEPRVLYLIKDFKTLWYGTDGENFFFASEEEFLEGVLGSTSIFSKIQWKEVEPYSGVRIDLRHRSIQQFPIQTKRVSYLPEPDENKVLVCASGGIDSTTAAYVAKKLEDKEVILVHFNYGQKSEERELESIKKIAKDLTAELIVVDLSWLGALGSSALTASSIDVPKSELENLKSTVCWVPARNLVMIAILMSIAEAKGCKYIYNGWTLEEEGSYPDNSVDFFKKFNQLSYYGTLTVPQVKLVLGRLMKSEVVMLGQYLDVDYSKTWSCDNGLEKHCGVCGACWLHHNAFIQAGLEDPTEYLEDPEYSSYERPYSGRTKVISIEEILRRIR